MRVIRRILLLIVVVAAALAVLVYLFGPHAQLAQAFNTYRAAYLAGDRTLVTRLTAPEAVARADVVRQLALTAPRAADCLQGDQVWVGKQRRCTRAHA